MCGGDVEDGRVELLLDAAERKDVQHALPALDQIDQLVAAAQHDGASVDHEMRGCDVEADVLTQLGEREANGLEANACIEEVLDDLQLEQIAVRVPASCAAARSIGQARADEIGARPVVELAVGDADDLRGPLAAEPLVGALDSLFRPSTHHSGVTTPV